MKAILVLFIWSKIQSWNYESWSFFFFENKFIDAQRCKLTLVLISKFWTKTSGFLCLVLLQVPKCFVPVQIFWASPKIWLHLVPLQKLLCWHKNQFYRFQNVLCQSKFFVSYQKFIYILCQSQTFCARTKNDLKRY